MGEVVTERKEKKVGQFITAESQDVVSFFLGPLYVITDRGGGLPKLLQ